MQDKQKKAAIQQIRKFNRFYTDLIGLLNQHFLSSTYSLVEGRILFEISNAGSIQASQIMASMHIDKSYLSRLLKKLEMEQLIIRRPSPTDARAIEILLTEKGQAEFEILNQKSEKQISDLLEKISPEKSKELASHMSAITYILKEGH
ncbi:MarR family winged helix-turn-helix transcriptional regulator [Pedobacter nutrimenti]|jgi:DNA-binding MarR family transcriptional regulator|uniref:DNA-binding MarR family transcriptional regulator n=1 Tax=Pedobacter nutrimenti TaxID=1241337 RepID=A0A318V039_9SPHI|nr:MarR family winged helix-turn-helix transcriptional regulator [Pedobacter nutrimenti]PYF77219.1 DNA-binding MarR family transcriptional regulator [Pedobacter nutrimenti]